MESLRYVSVIFLPPCVPHALKVPLLHEDFGAWENIISGFILLASSVLTGPEYLWYSGHATRDELQVMVSRWNRLIMLMYSFGSIL